MTRSSLDPSDGKNLDFAEGMVLSFKSPTFDLSPLKPAQGRDAQPQSKSHIRLYNTDSDIRVEIEFCRGENKIWLNDCAGMSIGNGWGKERSVDESCGCH